MEQGVGIASPIIKAKEPFIHRANPLSEEHLAF